MFRLLICCAIIVFSACGAGPAAAQNSKVALVIGNGAYANATRLNNPARDASMVQAALRQAGFTTVTARTDLGLQAMQSALGAFANQAEGADVALIYYAGHGLEVDGRNFLIPIDARLETDRALEFEAVKLDTALSAVGGARVRIVILDACRDNPFSRSMRRSAGTRSLGRGLAQVEADDILIMYAAAAGQTAADGAGSNSPFATALARRLPEAGLELRLLAGKVRDDVLAATAGTQRPFIAASITGEAIYLVPPRAVDTESLMWQGALQANTRAAYEDYLRQFPAGRFAAIARENMTRLSATTSAPQSPPRPNATAMPRRVGEVFSECPSCPSMVVVPAGAFQMGSQNGDPDERPVTNVAFSKPFAIGRFEVTFAQYDACVSEGGCGTRPRDMGWGRLNLPVVNVTWDDANRYARWLSRKAGASYRLPTEAEWEYAARAGASTSFALGDALTTRDANFARALGRTREVGAYPANRWGLFDVHGNAAEWMANCTTTDYAGAAPGQAGLGDNVACAQRVIRGGSWNITEPDRLRLTNRSGAAPISRDEVIGFRVVRDVN